MADAVEGGGGVGGGGGGSTSIAANTILGNNTGSTANATGLTPGQVASLVPIISGTPLLASAYGILPTNTGAQNDTGFALLKTAMLADTTKTWHVFFAPGAYLYTNNRWLFGVQRVIIEAYDCTFQNTLSNAWELNSRPLNTGDYFNDVGDAARTGANDLYVTGYLFNTAAAGAASITCTTHADAGNFTAGMRVVIHGYDQQGTNSYPFNLRYFEVKKVLTANSSTGVVTFVNQLEYNYDSRWWETTYGGGGTPTFGAPRILSLERTNYKHPKLIWLKGMTWLVNSTNAAFGVLTVSADLVIMEDVSETIYIPTTSDKTIYRRCKGISSAAIGGGASEVDKLLGSVVFEDCFMDGSLASSGAIDAATGCVSLSLIRTTCIYGCNQLQPRHLSIDDCDILGKPQGDIFGAISMQGSIPVTSASIKNTRIYNGGGIGVGIDTGAPLSFTVGSVTGTDIKLTFDATGKALAYGIDYGMTLQKSDGSKVGTITAIYVSSGNLVISGTWATPVAAETWTTISNCIYPSDGGGNSIIGTALTLWRSGNNAPTGPTNLILPGSPQISNALYFPNTANTYIQNANGIQVTVNNVNIGYFQSSAFNMQGSNAITFGVGGGISYTEGANGLLGVATLVAGTVTVSTTKAGAASRIFLTCLTPGGTPGFLRVSAISNGTSFTILSSSGTDTSVVSWFIINHL